MTVGLMEECHGITQECLMRKKISWSIDMDMVYNIGQTELIMKDNGISIKLKVKELFGTQKGMSIEANSEMIWPMDMENIPI